jgi:hypothetical protein
LAVTLAMGVALITTAWASRRRVNEASELLVIGQTQSFLRGLFDELRQAPAISEAELLDFLADNSSSACVTWKCAKKPPARCASARLLHRFRKKSPTGKGRPSRPRASAPASA